MLRPDEDRLDAWAADALSGLPPPPPPGFEARVMARVARTPQVRPATAVPDWAAGWPGAGFWELAAALLAGLLLAGAFLLTLAVWPEVRTVWAAAHVELPAAVSWAWAAALTLAVGVELALLVLATNDEWRIGR